MSVNFGSLAPFTHFAFVYGCNAWLSAEQLPWLTCKSATEVELTSKLFYRRAQLEDELHSFCKVCCFAANSNSTFEM